MSINVGFAVEMLGQVGMQRHVCENEETEWGIEICAIVQYELPFSHHYEPMGY